MSFNIRTSNLGAGPNRWERRRETLARLIQDHSPDLLGCQEVTPGQRHFLADRLGPEYACWGQGRNPDGGGEQATIFWRAPRLQLVDHWNYWLSPTPTVAGTRGWDASLPRICTLVRLGWKDVPERTVLVANTHFDHWGRRSRFQSARLVLDILQKLSLTDERIVLLGDLNALEGELSVQQLKSRLSDTFRHYAPRAGVRASGTFHAFLGPYFPLPPRIDYIFADRGAHVEKALVVRTRGSSAGYPSDHYPVISELAW